MASTYVLKSQVYNTRYMYVTCEQVKDIAANKSTINWTLTVTGGTVNNYSTGATTLTIGGTQVYYSPRVAYSAKTFPAAKGSVSGTLVVPHDNNGKAQVTVSLTTAIYVSTLETKSGVWELDEIPQGARITTAPNFNDEENPTITYSNFAGNAVTSIQACITLANTNADIAYRDISKTSGTYTFNLTEGERNILRNATLSGSDNRKLFFKIKTVMGGNTFVDIKEATFTVVNAEPILGGSVLDVSQITTALTGNPHTIIKGYNSMYVDCLAEGRKGASIASYKVTNGGKVINTATGYFNYTESGIFNFTVTDNRGLTTTKTVTLPVIDYKKLTCNLSASIELVAEAEAKIVMDISGNYFYGTFGAQRNSFTVRYIVVEDGDASSAEWVTIDDVTPQYINQTFKLTKEITGLDYSKTYTVTVAAYDSIGGKESAPVTLQTTPLFDWGANDFNFNVPVCIKGVEIDYIVEQGQSGDWRYRKWNSGWAECWMFKTFSTGVYTNWDNGYVGTPTGRFSYPFPFTKTPVEIANLLASSSAGVLMVESGGNGINGTHQTASYNVFRGSPLTTNTAVWALSLYVSGYWK